jgi:hypothetical protein
VEAVYINEQRVNSAKTGENVSIKLACGGESNTHTHHYTSFRVADEYTCRAGLRRCVEQHYVFATTSIKLACGGELNERSKAAAVCMHQVAVSLTCTTQLLCTAGNCSHQACLRR